jgi:type VII secretion integral membrane protein EccD
MTALGSLPMTAGLGGPGGQVGPAVPASCRVSILVGADHQVDMVLPAAVPLEVLVDPTREAINRRLRVTGDAELDGGRYVFARAAGMTRLSGSTSLAAQGVLDGDLLALVPAADAVRYTPNIENVSTALAQWAREHFPSVSRRDAAVMAALLAVLSLTTAGAVLWRLRWHGGGWIPAAVMAAMAAALGAAAWVAVRLRSEPAVVGLVAGAAGCAATAAGACAPPGANLGAPHAFLAAVMAAVSAAAVAKLTGAHWVSAAAVMVIAVSGLAAAGVRMFFAVPGQRLAVVMLLVMLMASVGSSALARKLARVPRQSFRSISGRDLFSRAPGQPEDTLTPVADSPQDVTLRGEEVAAVALRANRVLRGVLIGIAVVQVVASWFAINPAGGRQWPMIVVVAVCGICAVLRARAFRDRRCAFTLVGAGALSLLAIPLHLGLTATTTAGALGSAGAAALLAVGILVAGIAVPGRSFSETLREIVEWLEYILYVLVVPFAAWAVGYLQYVRNH